MAKEIEGGREGQQGQYTSIAALQFNERHLLVQEDSQSRIRVIRANSQSDFPIENKVAFEGVDINGLTIAQTDASLSMRWSERTSGLDKPTVILNGHDALSDKEIKVELTEKELYDLFLPREGKAKRASFFTVESESHELIGIGLKRPTPILLMITPGQDGIESSPQAGLQDFLQNVYRGLTQQLTTFQAEVDAKVFEAFGPDGPLSFSFDSSTSAKRRQREIQKKIYQIQSLLLARRAEGKEAGMDDPDLFAHAPFLAPDHQKRKNKNTGLVVTNDIWKHLLRKPDAELLRYDPAVIGEENEEVVFVPNYLVEERGQVHEEVTEFEQPERSKSSLREKYEKWKKYKRVRHTYRYKKDGFINLSYEIKAKRGEAAHFKNKFAIQVKPEQEIKVYKAIERDEILIEAENGLEQFFNYAGDMTISGRIKEFYVSGGSVNLKEGGVDKVELYRGNVVINGDVQNVEVTGGTLTVIGNVLGKVSVDHGSARIEGDVQDAFVKRGKLSVEGDAKGSVTVNDTDRDEKEPVYIVGSARHINLWGYGKIIVGGNVENADLEWRSEAVVHGTVTNAKLERDSTLIVSEPVQGKVVEGGHAQVSSVIVSKDLPPLPNREASILTDNLQRREQDAWQEILGRRVEIKPLPSYVTPDVQRNLERFGLTLRYIPDLKLDKRKLKSEGARDYIKSLQSQYPQWRAMEQWFWELAKNGKVDFPELPGQWVAVETVPDFCRSESSEIKKLI